MKHITNIINKLWSWVTFSVLNPSKLLPLAVYVNKFPSACLLAIFTFPLSADKLWTLVKLSVLNPSKLLPLAVYVNKFPSACLLAIFIFPLSVFVSCEQIEDFSQETTALQFVVSDFPAFQDSSPESGEVAFRPEGSVLTRAIGTQDEGKTAWENGDQIIVTLISKKYGEQAVALTYDGSSWSTEASLSYLENETPSVSVFYAPCYEVTEEGTMQLRSGMQLGMTEYLSGNYEIENGIMTITFGGATRDYSRLRIAGLANQTLTVTTTDFTPAGVNNSSPESGATRAAEEALNVLPCPKEGSTVPCATGARSVPQAEGSVTYTLTTDNNGNAFLYGVFAEDATVSVKQGDITLKDYTFTAEKNPNGTEHNKSYALDATPVIDGTLGGKAEATEDDITALVEQLKEYVDNGIATIIVPGSEPATIDMGLWINTAIGEAIYRLSKDESYNGKIDLILPDVTEIFDQEFHSARALNSITLPKVTNLADQAFYGTLYLRTITFGSVITEVNELGAIFNQVGYNVGGCDLILNCGQMKENSVPTPDLTTNTWQFKFENEFKSITLTHTGECDECKANQ